MNYIAKIVMFFCYSDMKFFTSSEKFHWRPSIFSRSALNLEKKLEGEGFIKI